MSLFGPSKQIVSAASVIRGRAESAWAFIDRGDVDGLCEHLKHNGCEFGRAGNNVSWSYSDLPFEFYCQEREFMIVGKMQYFGFHLSRASTRFAVNVKKQLSALGFPTTKEAIELKKVLVKSHGFLDVNKYV